MPPDHEKSSFHLERPDKPANKKDVELGAVENSGVLRLAMWGGAFVFACLLIASTFKKSKKTISPKRSREGDSDLDVGGIKESTTRDADDKAREMEGLLLLLSSSTDIISHPCHTSSKMLTNSIEDSEDENLPLTTEPILEKKEEENIVVIIYEEEAYTNSEEQSIENATQKYDESSKVAQSFPSTAFGEDDKNRPSSTSSSSSSSLSSSSSSSSSEETSSSGVLSQEIDGDDKNIDIIIYIDDDDEINHEQEHAHI